MSSENGQVYVDVEANYAAGRAEMIFRDGPINVEHNGTQYSVRKLHVKLDSLKRRIPDFSKAEGITHVREYRVPASRAQVIALNYIVALSAFPDKLSTLEADMSDVSSSRDSIGDKIAAELEEEIRAAAANTPKKT